ncbi:CarD family transcriptional regulator [Clostridiales Family XIII bacterium PM5-7]
MFSAGDKILYPMHGAGVIQDIEERDILGETKRYYILKFPFGDMSVMIPVDKGPDVGIRPIIPQSEIEAVFVVLHGESSEMSGNWNRRQRENMDKLRTGDIMLVAEVVRNLLRLDRVKKLSTGEKKMLTNAKQILMSELVLAGDIDPLKVDDLVEDAV